MLRIRDVYPGSWIFCRPRSRIQHKQKKMREIIFKKEISSQNYGLDPRYAIREPGTRIKKFPDFGSRGQKAPDPGSGSATLAILFQMGRMESAFLGFSRGGGGCRGPGIIFFLKRMLAFYHSYIHTSYIHNIQNPYNSPPASMEEKISTCHS